MRNFLFSKISLPCALTPAMIKSYSIILLFILGFTCEAQYLQNTQNQFKELDLNSYGFVGFQSSNWIFSVDDLGMMGMPPNASVADAFYRGSYSEFNFDYIDLGANGTVVASNLGSNSLIAVSRDEGQSFVEYTTSFSNENVVVYNDTLYSFTGGSFTATESTIMISADFGETWNEGEEVPFKSNTTFLLPSNHGYPVYFVFNATTFTSQAFELRGGSVVELSIPGSFLGRMTGNQDYIFAMVLTGTKGELYSYDRTNQTWSNLSEDFLPYEFSPENFTVNNSGDLCVFGTRTLVSTNQLVSYIYDGSNWSEVPLPVGVVDVNDYGGFNCEGSNCIAKTTDGWYESNDLGQTWQELSFYNSNVLGGLSTSNGYLCLRDNKLLRVNGSVTDLIKEVSISDITSAKFYGDDAFIYLWCSNGVQSKLLFSDNIGNTWEEVSLPDASAIVKATLGEEIVISGSDGAFYYKQNISDSWKRMKDWTYWFQEYDVTIQAPSRYFLWKKGAGNGIVSQGTDTTYANMKQSYIAASNDSEVLDMVSTPGAVYMLVKNKQIGETFYEYELLSMNDQSEDWVSVMKSVGTPVSRIAYPEEGILAYVRDDRNLILYQWKNDELQPLYAKIPKGAIPTSFSKSANELFVSTKYAGLWSMPTSSLTISESNELEISFNSYAYPNPSRSGLVRFNWEDNSPSAFLKVYNAIGEQIMMQSILKESEVDMNLPVGIYVYSLEMNGIISHGKMIVQ
jgi:photosystem II stability/assembly factor-like uncharacterized protein